MSSRPLPQCVTCVHWVSPLQRDDEDARRPDPIQICDAFHKGIPDDIWWNRADHRKPYEGDHGIRFESIEPEDDVERSDYLDDEEDLTDDDAPGPDDVEDDEDFDDETLAHIHALLDEEDDEPSEVNRADLAIGRERLHEYWTIGKGLRKWLGHPHPWTSLYRHLRKYVGSERAKRMAAKWVHEVTGNWPGSDAHRVATGHKPRGHRIGPG